jgi:hypothetical protein
MLQYEGAPDLRLYISCYIQKRGCRFHRISYHGCSISFYTCCDMVYQLMLHPSSVNRTHQKGTFCEVQPPKYMTLNPSSGEIAVDCAQQNTMFLLLRLAERSPPKQKLPKHLVLIEVLSLACQHVVTDTTILPPVYHLNE